MIRQIISLPDSTIRILAPLVELDYFDSQAVTLARPIAPLEAWNRVTGRPQPLLKAAFKTRDAISALFGVKRIGGFSSNRANEVTAGDYLDFFLVEYVDDTTLVLTERDKHLDVMTCISSDGAMLAITSSVIVHNWFGRAYMIPVGPAHRLIVDNMLKNLQRNVANET